MQPQRCGRRHPLDVSRKALRLCLPLLGLLLLLPAASAASPSALEITYNIDGVLGQNGWYRGSRLGNSIIIYWHISPPTAVVVSGCEQGRVIPGPTTGTTASCHAQDGADDLTRSVTVKIDADPPMGLSGVPSRSPDFNGWFNHPLSVTWKGSDATSGIAGCSSTNYGGPDTGNAAVTGACTDQAGNTATNVFGFSYDATPPVLKKVSVTSEATAQVVHWHSSRPSDTVVVQRWARGNKKHPMVFRGSGSRFADTKVKSGIEYLYAVQSFDQAGNPSKRITAAGLPKVLTLRKTPYVPRAASKPILRWDATKGATYYHVQLFRGSRRILAAWPSRHQLGLPKAWRWNGDRYRLRHGLYRWYVWAGIGDRALARYRPLGSARFIVPR
jgi:hypothetical protein